MASPLKITSKSRSSEMVETPTANSNSSPSLLSPISSPAPQVKQHGAGNLTGHLRKVKDLAADFHNLTQKWETLKSQGMNILTEIANILLSKVFNTLDDASNTPQVLPAELGPLCESLSDIVDLMESIISKMQHKVAVAEGLISLQNFQKTKPDTNVLFATMTLEDVAQIVKSIEEDYRKEMEVKQEIAKVLVHTEGRDVVMFYLASWMHEPYIHEKNADQLKALLKDTGHIK